MTYGRPGGEPASVTADRIQDQTGLSALSHRGNPAPWGNSQIVA